MHISPRQLLTSGTAMAAVAGALLLGAEDAGLAQYSRSQAEGADVTDLWMSDAPSRGTLNRHHPADRGGANERR